MFRPSLFKIDTIKMRPNSRFLLLLASTMTTAACGGSIETTGSIEGYLYVEESCGASGSEVPYIITNSSTPPKSYKVMPNASVMISCTGADHMSAFALTDAAGHFFIRYIPPGTHTVSASANFDKSEDIRVAHFAVTIERGKITKAFKPVMGTLSGYLASCHIDEKYGPLPYFEESNTPPSQGIQNALLRVNRSPGCPVDMVTGDLGYFALENIQAGQYAMKVNAESQCEVLYMAIVQGGDLPTEFWPP